MLRKVGVDEDRIRGIESEGAQFRANWGRSNDTAFFVPDHRRLRGVLEPFCNEIKSNG